MWEERTLWVGITAGKLSPAVLLQHAASSLMLCNKNHYYCMRWLYCHWIKRETPNHNPSNAGNNVRNSLLFCRECTSSRRTSRPAMKQRDCLESGQDHLFLSFQGKSNNTAWWFPCLTLPLHSLYFCDNKIHRQKGGSCEINYFLTKEVTLGESSSL